MRRGAVGLCVALVSAACVHRPATLPDGVPVTAEARYRCQDGRSFVVRFDNRADIAVLTMDGRTIVLRGQRPASGIWYARAGYTLRGKGDVARLDRPDGTGSECRAG